MHHVYISSRVGWLFFQFTHIKPCVMRTSVDSLVWRAKAKRVIQLKFVLGLKNRIAGLAIFFGFHLKSCLLHKKCSSIFVFFLTCFVWIQKKSLTLRINNDILVENVWFLLIVYAPPPFFIFFSLIYISFYLLANIMSTINFNLQLFTYNALKSQT